MPADYIPNADAEFSAWLANFETYAAANLAGLGLVAGDVAPVTAARADWEAKLAAHVTAQAAAQGARQAKDLSRATVEGLVRPLVRRLQASASVDDAERGSLGITVPDTTPTPSGPPTTRPVLKVDSGERLRHTLHFTDAATPTRKARPAGVQGCEIYVAVVPAGTPAPGDPAAYTFVTLDTRTPHLLQYDGTDGGKTAHVIARWVSTRGEKGPWSETATATIGA
jgi:hypothetical protein